MATFRKLTTVAVMLAAASILFAVICPLAAAPQAVLRAHSDLAPPAAVAAPALLGVICAPAAPLLFPSLPEDRSRPISTSVPLVDLTCARLC